jgi:hypothetical protein
MSAISRLNSQADDNSLSLVLIFRISRPVGRTVKDYIACPAAAAAIGGFSLIEIILDYH